MKGGSAGKSRQQEARAEGEVATQLTCEEEIMGNNMKPAQRCGPWQAERILLSALFQNRYNSKY